MIDYYSIDCNLSESFCKLILHQLPLAHVRTSIYILDANHVFPKPNVQPVCLGNRLLYDSCSRLSVLASWQILLADSLRRHYRPVSASGFTHLAIQYILRIGATVPQWFEFESNWELFFFVCASLRVQKQVMVFNLCSCDTFVTKFLLRFQECRYLEARRLFAAFFLYGQIIDHESWQPTINLRNYFSFVLSD